MYMYICIYLYIHTFSDVIPGSIQFGYDELTTKITTQLVH